MFAPTFSKCETIQPMRLYQIVYYAVLRLHSCNSRIGNDWKVVVEEVSISKQLPLSANDLSAINRYKRFSKEEKKTTWECIILVFITFPSVFNRKFNDPTRNSYSSIDSNSQWSQYLTYHHNGKFTIFKCRLQCVNHCQMVSNDVHVPLE